MTSLHTHDYDEKSNTTESNNFGDSSNREIVQNSKDLLNRLFTYNPNEQQNNQLNMLLDLLNLGYTKNIKISLVGGYGLDSLLGFLTRDHGDIDLLIEESNIKDFEKLLLSLEFTLIEKTEFVVRYKNKEGIKIEFNNHGSLEKLGIQKNNTDYFPNTPNGSFNGNKVYTPSLIGHKSLIEIQNLRAKQLGWKEYLHKNHQLSIIKSLEQK